MDGVTGDEAETADVDRESAADAMGSLADADRIAILLALRNGRTRRFADLQSAAGFEDSGRFNYHLDRLLGRFVAKTDGGYRLRAAGAKAVDLVTDERFGEPPEPVTLDLDADCPSCGARLRARYAEENVEVACIDCSTLVHYGYLPPRARRGRDVEALFEAYGKRLWRDFTLAHRGVCPACSGRTETRVERGSDHHLHFPAVSRCRDCGAEVATAVGLRLLADPAVVAFLADHGESVDDRPFWEFEFCIDDGDVAVASEKPFRVVVPIARDDETLRVTVDEAGSVVETARVRRR
ncbi:transcriptional regulator [Halobium salinum]|uniref:Transcriptional regulator n=1 Tax=Halobium salinum TaxID=1364940 RepID=A0ABD5PCF9_9EURY|nr:transcriptional regulator [Halobium salinum]